MYKFLFILALILPVSLVSQVNIIEDSNVQKVVEWYKRLKSKEKGIEGWAVQIISTRDRRQMEETRDNFRLRYPQYTIVNDYIEPLYRLRVGKFINKLEALALRNELMSRYRSALLIRQNFNKSDFY